MKNTKTKLERINIVVEFYLERGLNKESLNEVRRKIIKNQ
jgi:hypothetical protein